MMGGQVQGRIQPVLGMLAETRGQWIKVKTSIEQDRALINDIKNRLRGSLGVTAMLTGQQGAAFEAAIARYHDHALRAEGALQELIDQLNRCENSMRGAAENADFRIGNSMLREAETLLGYLLPEIQLEAVIAFGEYEVYEAAARHRQSVFSLFEQTVLADVEHAYNAITYIMAELAADIHRLARELNDTIAYVCGVLNTGLGLVDAITPFVEDALKDTKLGAQLKDIGERVPYVGVILTGVGIALDWGSEAQRSLSSLASDFAGGLFATAVGDTGPGAIVVGALTLMQFSSTIASAEQGVLANVLAAPGSMLHGNLDQLAKNWGTTAANLNVGKVFDDWGSVAVDVTVADATTVMSLAVPQFVSTTTAAHWQRQETQDSMNALAATGRLGVGVYQFKVNAEATVMSDSAALSNFAVQRAPFPSSFKSAYAQSTAATVQNMTDVSNLITNGQWPTNSPPGGHAALATETAMMAISNF